MNYVQLGADNRVVVFGRFAENPDPRIWIEAPWDRAPDVLSDWRYVGGRFVYEPRPSRLGTRTEG